MKYQYVRHVNVFRGVKLPGSCSNLRDENDRTLRVIKNFFSEVQK